ncbi:MAG: GNAT family N-acetyltransferase [bacterium]|nr:GNAT family N-acetyltransferase [bacterium]
MLKAVIFDMDGVIVDTEPQHLRALIKAGETFHAQLSYKYCEQFIGRHMDDLLRTVTKDYPQITNGQAFADLYNEYKITIRDEEGLIPIEGTINLIRSLHDYGVKVAIASSSEPYEINHVVKALSLESYVDALISGSMVAHSKPSPDIFLLAATTLDVSPEECIIIEDSMNGSIAASRANITCIGYQNKNSGNQDLSKTCCIYEDMMSLDYTAVLEEYNRTHGLPVDILSTDRLQIKELAVSDIKDLYQIYKQPGVTNYIPSLLSLEEEEEKHAAYIKHVYNFYRFGLWGVYLKDSLTLIGRAGLQCIDIEDTTEIEIGYLIAPEYQHQGFASECIKAIIRYAKEFLELPSLVAVIHPENKASITLAHKFGFKFEATHNKNGINYSIYRLFLT